MHMKIYNKNMMDIKRVLLKISGEYFAGDLKTGINFDILRLISSEIKEIVDAGFELSIVIGGGNIYRGTFAKDNGLEREKADYIGMLGTVINALSLEGFLKKIGVKCVVMSSINISPICKQYRIDEARSLIRSGHVVIFSSGTGNPYFSTDTAAVLKALEMNAEVVVKATKVDGIYSDDPEKNSAAEFFPELTYDEVLVKNLQIMDLPAISLAKVNSMPIIVGSIKEYGNILKILQNKGRFSIVK